MHPFLAFVNEHGITTYEGFLHHEDLLTYPKFQKIMPTYLLWSNELDGQLQRAFAASVPMATIFDTRFVDGPDEPLEKRGPVARSLGLCERTELEKLLKKSWDISTKDELLAQIDQLAHTAEDHCRAYEVLIPELYQVVQVPLEERPAMVDELREKAVERGQRVGASEDTTTRWWATLTQPFLEDDADLTLPPADALPSSLFAWNSKRLAVLAWIGTRIGLVTVDEVERVMRSMIVSVQERYRTWREFQDAYHVARRYWLGESELNYDDQIAGAWMLRHAHSPWSILPLSPDDPTLMDQPTRHSRPASY